MNALTLIFQGTQTANHKQYVLSRTRLALNNLAMRTAQVYLYDTEDKPCFTQKGHEVVDECPTMILNATTKIKIFYN